MTDEILELNVGGTLFTTTRDTLCRYPDSMMAKKFDTDSPFGTLLRDKQDRIFLDRNPGDFRYVLEFLRKSQLILPRSIPDEGDITSLVESILSEADYFGVLPLVELCKKKLPLKDARLQPVRIIDWVVETESHLRKLEKKINELIKQGYTLRECNQLRLKNTSHDGNRRGECYDWEVPYNFFAVLECKPYP